MRKIIITIALLFPFVTHALSIGVISDIHAGKQKTRKSGSSIVYPSKAVSYFDKALAQMNGKVDFVVCLGDNAQSGEKKYYKRLKTIELKRKIKILWVKGNHDSKYFSILGPSTFTYSVGSLKFSVIDTTYFFLYKKLRR